jgi:hypothetical protein
MKALMFNRTLSGKDLFHNADIFFYSCNRLAISHAMPAFHHLRARSTQTNKESTI